jgi:autotransporter-associated beta strand protein
VISSRDGFVRFSGGGDYTLFVVNQGTASLGANNGVCPNASISIGASGGATFDLNGFNQALTGLNDGAANAKLVTNSAATLSTLTMNLAAASTYSGVIAGKLALVANGTGSLLLSGTNNYTGNTTVNGGTLELAVASIATNTTVTVASGATLQLDFIETNRIASLVLNGVAQTAGVYNTTTSPTFITGSGSLIVAPSVSTTSTNIVAKVNGGNLELTWPADHTGWRLQVQTNSLASGLNTNWSDVPGAASVNSVTNIINAANGSVFYRMVYP